MPQPRYPLRINVGFLIRQSIGASRDVHFEFPELTFRESEPGLGDELILDSFDGVLHIGRTQQGLVVQGEFSGKTTMQCVRCLNDFSQPLNATFDELYAFDYRSVSESGLIVPEDANVDFGPLVREYLLIEAPINPICRPDCKGLCPVCGEDLNRVVCAHASQPE